MLVEKRKTVAGVAMFILLIFVIATGLCGYFIFGEAAEADVLKDFDDQDVLIVIVRAGLLLLCHGRIQ
jgi:amino acid permease